MTRIIERQGVVALTAIAPCRTTVQMGPWRIVINAAEAAVFADAWRQAPRTLYGGTRIGEAFDDAVLALGHHRVVAGHAVIVVARTTIRSATDDPARDAAPVRRRYGGSTRRAGNAIGVGRSPGGARPAGFAGMPSPPGGLAPVAGYWGTFAHAM